MIPVATSRLFLLVALLLAAVLGVSAIVLVVNRSGVSTLGELSVAKTIASFRGEVASPSPDPTPLITPGEDQVGGGQVLGSTAVSAKSFPPLVFAAYPQNPFLPLAPISPDEEKQEPEFNFLPQNKAPLL